MIKRSMNSQIKWLTSVFFGVTVLAAFTLASEWELLNDSSSVRFIGVQEGSAFRGRFEDFSATVSFDVDNPSHGKIMGVVRVESVNSGDQERDSTLLDAEWFYPEKYPESRFESERIEEFGDGTFQAHGQLTLRGETRPVTMDFSFETLDLEAHLSGSFEIKRLDFGVGWPATNWVGDEVFVQVELDLENQ